MTENQQRVLMRAFLDLCSRNMETVGMLERIFMHDDTDPVMEMALRHVKHRCEMPGSTILLYGEAKKGDVEAGTWEIVDKHQGMRN